MNMLHKPAELRNNNADFNSFNFALSLSVLVLENNKCKINGSCKNDFGCTVKLTPRTTEDLCNIVPAHLGRKTTSVIKKWA